MIDPMGQVNLGPIESIQIDRVNLRPSNCLKFSKIRDMGLAIALDWVQLAKTGLRPKWAELFKVNWVDPDQP